MDLSFLPYVVHSRPVSSFYLIFLKYLFKRTDYETANYVMLFSDFLSHHFLVNNSSYLRDALICVADKASLNIRYYQEEK
jgi:hypothetical protein